MRERIVEGDFTPEFRERAEKANFVGLDIETEMNLDVNTTQWHLITGFIPTYGYELVRFPSRRPDNLLYMLDNREMHKIFHHGLFDLSVITRDTGAFVYGVRDTKIAAKVLDPKKELSKSHSLQALVDRFLCIHIPKGYATSDWTANTLSPEQIQYAKDDVAHLPNLYWILEKALIENHLWYQALESMMYLPTYIDLKRRGISNAFEYER